MKHKLLTFALMGAFASTMLFSCKNAEEPIPSPGDNNSGEMVEYSISVNIPEEMRTRSGSLGESGIFESELYTKIQKMWCLVYYDDDFLKTELVTRNDDSPFKLSLRLPNVTDPTKLYLFFWAYGYDNAKVDPYDFSEVKISSKERYVEIDHQYINSSSFNPHDSFTGYFQFSETPTNNLNASFTLNRPFAEFHILSDEFITTGIKDYYKDGFKTLIGVGSEKLEYANWQEQLMKPNIWHFDKPTKSASYEPSFDIVKNDFEFETQKDINYLYRCFENKLTGEAPYRTTFKDREMDYLGYFYLLAPPVKSQYVNKNDGNTVLGNLNFALYDPTWGIKEHTTTEFSSVPLPEEGVKANYRYIIYNKSRENGGTGLLTPVYTIEVQNDLDWDDTYQSEQGENRL